jgi:hypothetical protein
MHGRGLGDDAPMYVFSAGKDVQSWALETNASFITKPVVSRDGHADVIWGDSVVVTPSGVRRLDTLAPEFIANVERARPRDSLNESFAVQQRAISRSGAA